MGAAGAGVCSESSFVNMPKITYMGEEIKAEDLPAAPPVELNDYFAPVTLSGKAIDRASQLVPEEHWKALGIHTWLSRRANEAFKRMPVTEKKIKLNKLEYHFEYDAMGPVLKMVMLV